MAKKSSNKSKDFGVSVDPKEVVHTNISTSSDGYNYASILIKKADKEYMRISYEWAGDNIPGFALDLMKFMKDSSIETSGVWSDMEKAFEEYEDTFVNKDQ